MMSKSLRMMDVVHRPDGWWIIQEGWEDYGPFALESQAYSWADSNIDDQVYGDPNCFAPELRKQRG